MTALFLITYLFVAIAMAILLTIRIFAGVLHTGLE